MDRVELVKELRRSGRDAEAIPILMESLEEAEADRLGADPWPYEQLAIMHRKARRISEEREILERFARQRHPPGAKPSRLLDRLVKVYELQGLLSTPMVDGRTTVWHREFNVPLDEVPLFRRRGLVVDVETTGLGRADEVIEFAGVLFEFSVLSGRALGTVDRYQGLREPGCQINPGATRKHGLHLSDLRGKRLDRDRVESLIEQADLLIAHNASFDSRFVAGLFHRAANKPWHCSLRACSWTQRGFPSGKLDDLLETVGIVRNRTHRALDDVEALLSLLSRKPEPAAESTYLLEVIRHPPLYVDGPSATKPSSIQRPSETKSPSSDRTGCLTIGAVFLVPAGLMWWFRG